MNNDYVLITAARNEENYIEKTIQAVISQIVLPKKWVIVSDGSTDRTEEIVNNYAAKYNFIDLVKTSGDPERNFGSKAKAVNFGYSRLKAIDYQFVGNLDADVSFDSSYYEDILSKFQQNKNLGIAGGIRYDLFHGKFKKMNCSRNSVGGPIQLFRRSCYEEIGGYIPLEFGGIDAVAEIMARMHGWEVESFPKQVVYHYRTTGTATKNILRVRFYDGVNCYLIGYHPLFQTLRVVYRMFDKPYIIGSLVWICGYFWASIKKYKRPLSDELVQFLRSEQLKRLGSIVSRGKSHYFWM